MELNLCLGQTQSHETKNDLRMNLPMLVSIMVNLIDFNDMEQFALRILTEEREGELVPSVVAREYQDQYLEVMIDEYQDSNLVQEAILNSVSTVSREKNNVFMVGDVKHRFKISTRIQRRLIIIGNPAQLFPHNLSEQEVDTIQHFRPASEIFVQINTLPVGILQTVGVIFFHKQFWSG